MCFAYLFEKTLAKNVMKVNACKYKHLIKFEVESLSTLLLANS